MASQVDLYCQIGRERLLSQEWQNREFATKAINYLAFGSGMIGVGALVLRLSQPESAMLALWAFIALAVLFVPASVAGIYTLIPFKWRHGPDLGSMLQVLDNKRFTEGVADAYAEAIEENWHILDPKARMLTLGAIFLLLEATALTSLVVLCHWGGSFGGLLEGTPA